jgi:hypothetical protein
MGNYHGKTISLYGWLPLEWIQLSVLNTTVFTTDKTARGYPCEERVPVL